MSNYPISSLLVRVDHILDYVPYASTVTNIAAIVAKVVFSYFGEHFPSHFAAMQDNPLFNHISHQKSIAECILLAIPFLNVFVALLRDLPDTDPHPANERFNAELAGLREHLNQQDQQVSEHINQLRIRPQNPLAESLIDNNEPVSIGKVVGKILASADSDSAENQAKLNSVRDWAGLPSQAKARGAAKNKDDSDSESVSSEESASSTESRTKSNEKGALQKGALQKLFLPQVNQESAEVQKSEEEYLQETPLNGLEKSREALLKRIAAIDMRATNKKLSPELAAEFKRSLINIFKSNVDRMQTVLRMTNPEIDLSYLLQF